MDGCVRAVGCDFSQGFFSILSPMEFSPLACLVGDTSFPAQSST